MMTNKEIKKLCEEKQVFQGGKNYPTYKFKVTQTAKTISIYWEYLDGKCWTIDTKTLLVRDEHGEMMNEYFDYNDTLENTINSIIYYMVTRY